MLNSLPAASRDLRDADSLVGRLPLTLTPRYAAETAVTRSRIGLESAPADLSAALQYFPQTGATPRLPSLEHARAQAALRTADAGAAGAAVRAALRAPP